MSDCSVEVHLVDGEDHLRRGILSGSTPGWMDSMFLGTHRTASSFERRTDASSAELYFHYYGQLQHQQNMLSDALRTGTYHAAISENAIDFRGKAVLDVGTGSGILALFAAAAGARVVYAVEASASAEFAAELMTAQPSDVGHRVRIIRGRVEEVVLPEKVQLLDPFLVEKDVYASGIGTCVDGEQKQHGVCGQGILGHLYASTNELNLARWTC